MICPFCKEEIKDGAILCKFCKSNLSKKSDNDINQMPSEKDVETARVVEKPQPYLSAGTNKISGTTSIRKNTRKLLTIAIVVVGMFVAAILVLTSKSDREKLRLTMLDMSSIGRAIESYVTDWTFPPQVESFKDLNASFFVPEYIKQLPLKDAWGNDFIFTHGLIDTNSQDAYSIASSGRDGMFEGFDQTGRYIDWDNKDIIYSNGIFTYSPKLAENISDKVDRSMAAIYKNSEEDYEIKMASMDKWEKGMGLTHLEYLKLTAQASRNLKYGESQSSNQSNESPEVKMGLQTENQQESIEKSSNQETLPPTINVDTNGKKNSSDLIPEKWIPLKTHWENGINMLKEFIAELKNTASMEEVQLAEKNFNAKLDNFDLQAKSLEEKYPGILDWNDRPQEISNLETEITKLSKEMNDLLKDVKSKY